MKTIKNELGIWVLSFEDGEERTISVKNQAQAKFVNDNMYNLRIKKWSALETPYSNH